MTLDFSKPITNIGGDSYKENKPLHFGDFVLGNYSTPSPGWQDVTVSGDNYVNLPNAKADGLNYVKLFGGCQQRDVVLPTGYTRLEYIHNEGGTSGAYIELNLQPTASSVVEIKCSTQQASCQFLVATTNENNFFRIVKFSSGNTVGGSIGPTNYPSSLDGTTPTVIKIDHKKVYVNNVIVGDGSEATLTEKGNINILRGVYMNGLTYYSYGKIYYASISIDGVNLDFYGIPAKRNTDNKIGLYDIVNNVFYPSADNSHQFLAGAELTVPSPTNIMPIWCNNGELKSRSKSGLPVGYAKLNYISNASNTRIKVNVMPTVDDIEIELRCRLRDGSWYMFQSRASTQASMYGLGGAQATSSINFTWAGKSLQSNITRTAGNIATIKATAKDGAATLYVKDETAGVEDTQTGTYTTPPANYPSTSFYLWGNYSQYIGSNAYVYYLKFKVGGETALEYIPAKDSNGVAGFYDTVTGNFIDAPTTGSMSGGSVESDAEVYVDVTSVETVKDSLNNTATAENLIAVETYKDVQSVLDGVVTRKSTVRVLDGTENWQASSTSNVYYFNLPAYNAATVAVLSSHYVGTSELNANMPDNSIKHSFLQAQGTSQIYIKMTSAGNVEGLKTFLANQYTAGTPVIIVYPLAIATTETVTPQTLTIQEGTNIVEITQASISPLELEVSYKAGVTVTITEVENANLDNSVTVTIGE